MLIAIVFAGAIFFLIHSLNTLAGQSREQLRQELQKLLGKDVTFDGLEVSLWSGLGFSAREFRIADNPRFAATPLVRARELKLGVSITQLLLGRIVVDSLTFEDPEFQVITDEAGRLNLSALADRKKEAGSSPRSRAARQERNHTAANFLITKMQIRNGRVDFIDRSVKEPAELQVRNVEMELKGLNPRGKTRIRFTAAIAEGLSHDVRIEGELGPSAQGLNWLQQPVELEIQLDSLQVPLLTRAMPILRNKIPRELEVAGPFAMRAKVSGTFERPRITDVILKGLLFGSSDYNATLTGQVELPESRAWSKAQLKGKFTLDPVKLTDLRRLPQIEALLPATLVTEGPVSIYSQFEGTWKNLRIGALIKAGRSEIRFGDWLRKPAGNPAELRAAISRLKNGLILHKSALSLGSSKMTLSGAFEESPEPRLRLKLQNEPSPLAAWSHFVPGLSFYGVRGKVVWDLTFEGKFPTPDGRWKLGGKLKLADAELRHKESGRKIDQLDADVSFAGREARVENASFRLGSSNIKMTASVADLAQPKAGFKFSSRELNPMDLPIFPANISNQIKDVTFAGEAQIDNGAPLVEGIFSSAEGTLDGAAYRDLRADVSWSPRGISFKDFFLRAMNGTIQSQGFWMTDSDHTQRFELTSELASVDVAELVKQNFPQLKGRVEGQLNLRGRFNATPQNGATIQQVVRGAGETAIYQGTIRDINLIAMFLPRHRGVSDSTGVASRLPPMLTESVNRQDTPFDVIKASFTVERQRLRTDNLILVTPDYTITAAGWVGFDKTTRWSGLFVLSQHLTQELQQEHKAIRHLLDRRGRLALSFRVEGRLPNVKIRPENRALAQALGVRSPQTAEGATGSGEEEQEKRDKGEWLPKSLEELLRR
ncbi:MAG: AsmA-like C-terminal region-containing protein [Candidatus Binatia bacterium]